jgi:hypothetical protein
MSKFLPFKTLHDYSIALSLRYQKVLPAFNGAGLGSAKYEGISPYTPLNQKARNAARPGLGRAPNGHPRRLARSRDRATEHDSPARLARR